MRALVVADGEPKVIRCGACGEPLDGDAIGKGHSPFDCIAYLREEIKRLRRETSTGVER